MLRFAAAGAMFAGILSACAGWRPTSIEAPCVDHLDPADCQAALEAAQAELSVDPADYQIVVAPISCTARGCSTWVSSIPRDDGECRPTGEVEVGRALVGAPWTILSISHGDPPCAFES